MADWNKKNECNTCGAAMMNDVHLIGTAFEFVCPCGKMYRPGSKLQREVRKIAFQWIAHNARDDSAWRAQLASALRLDGARCEERVLGLMHEATTALDEIE